MIMAGLKTLALFDPHDASANAVFAKAEAHNAKQQFKLPNDGRFEYVDMPINTKVGMYHCLRLKRKGSKPDKAVIYIPGGGAVYDYASSQIFLAKNLLSHVGAEIFYPFYPPTTQCSLQEAYTMIFECYRKAIGEYGGDRTAVVGISSGATAAMSMITWNNYYKEDIAMPALTIALSPCHVPANENEDKMLEAYRGIDPIIPVDLVRTYAKINSRGCDEMPGWMIHTAQGDFRNAGKIMIYWGEKESLAFSAPIFEKSLKEAGVDYKIHIEKEMPHTYACMRVNKACRDSYDEYVREINALGSIGVK